MHGLISEYLPSKRQSAIIYFLGLKKEKRDKIVSLFLVLEAIFSNYKDINQELPNTIIRLLNSFLDVGLNQRDLYHMDNFFKFNRNEKIIKYLFKEYSSQKSPILTKDIRRILELLKFIKNNSSDSFNLVSFYMPHIKVQKKLFNKLLRGLLEVNAFISIKNLHLENTAWSFNSGLNFLLNSGNYPLERLTLIKAGLTDRIIFGLPRANSLTVLDLSSNKLRADTARIIASMPNLRVLRLKENSIGDAGVTYLSTCRSLKVLDLSSNSITIYGVVQIVLIKGLTHLLLNYNKIDDTGVKHISTLKLLKILELDNNFITDASIKYFRSLNELKKLKLKGNLLTRTGISMLLQHLTQSCMFIDD